MPSSIPTTQLRRQLWGSFRASVDGVLWKASRRQPRPNPLGLRQVAQSPPVWPSSGLFRSSKPFSSSSRNSNNVKRSCTSGGLLLLGLSSPSSSTPKVVASCAAAADTAILNIPQRRNVTQLAFQSWRLGLHAGDRRGDRILGLRRKSSKANEGIGNSVSNQAKPEPQKAAEAAKSTTPPPDPETVTGSVSKYLQSHLPKMPHRPTREELLAAANGFWERLKVRFKWFSIRSMRPWNADEWGAFVSWFMLGHLVWILVGTTTFFSLVIFMVNTVFAQEELAKWVGDYLTKSAGVTVVFESAIVPKWKNGVISFRNVFVSRRPGQVKSVVKKGSSTNAAAIAAAHHTHDSASQEDDGNYTQFDVTINSVDVTLSFLKWWNGHGMLKDVEVKGVRGVVDRTSVLYTDGHIDPLSYRHEHQPGDFEIEHFKLEDLLLTIHQPGGFRPFPVSIFSCELPQLRKQWLFYDFLSANHVSGSFDGSLFTIHPRQVHGAVTVDDSPVMVSDTLGEASAWKKFSRLRIDGLKIDHLNRGDRGPFGWIYEGNVDIVADVMIPADADEGIGKVMSDFYDKMEEAVTSNRYVKMVEDNLRGASDVIIDSTIGQTIQQEGHISQAAQATPEPAPTTDSPPHSTNPHTASGENPRYLVMDLRMHLNDVRAAVPLFPPSDSLGHSRTRSYINAALIRPIVAYINAKRTYIPITCRIVKRASDFDGSWSIYDCGLMDDSSAEMYTAFARDVEDQQSRVRRLKKVGFWTLSMVVHAMLAGVAGDLM